MFPGKMKTRKPQNDSFERHSEHHRIVKQPKRANQKEELRKQMKDAGF
jgi:hypothetical protein